jgi:HAD superfamily phosphatase (TIGR01668 family)
MSKILSRLFVCFHGFDRSKNTVNTLDFLQRVTTVATIDRKVLQSLGIKGIILDLDNTVVSEDDRYLSPHAETWLEKANLEGFQFFILSNGKRKHRLLYWSQRLNMPAINPAKKPFPRNFRRAFKHMGLSANEIVVIGDSFHTDVLGAFFSGCWCIQVASLPHPPRWWEKLFGRWVHKPYPKNLELWDAD